MDMKVFKGGASSWDSKVNFVDMNDVFVGYDMGQSCCEDAGYFIADSITPYKYDMDKIESHDIEHYIFDKDFFEYVPSEDLDCGGMVAFKLVSDGKPELFLHLYNAHNGYYGHGFEVKHGGEIVKDYYL
jgi:hypothetical protein